MFPNCLMNGAYIGSKSIEDIEAIAASAAGGVVVGSISVRARCPNPGQGYWLHREGFFSLNSYGLPNGGLSYYRERLPRMAELVHGYGKPLIANLVAFGNADYEPLIVLADAAGADLIELNLGCPNVWEGGSQKRIVSYHADMVREVLADVRKCRRRAKVIVKISPLPPDILDEVTKVIIESGVVTAITATNSYPNAYVTKGARGVAEPTDRLAGLSGRALKPISLGVVKQLSQILPPYIDIIGCGGVSTAGDVEDYLAAGAKAVQVASALKDEGLSVFAKILEL